MSMSTADGLREALGLIEDERCWGQGQNHLRIGGVDKYCAVGALQHVSVLHHGYDHLAQMTFYKAMVAALGRLVPDLPVHACSCADECKITGFNDNTTHSKVVSLFKDAIIAEEAAA